VRGEWKVNSGQISVLFRCQEFQKSVVCGAVRNRDLLSLSAKTRILQTQISTNRPPMRTLMIYLYLTGVHLMGVHFNFALPIVSSRVIP
jgi:hypothetical protein